MRLHLRVLACAAAALAACGGSDDLLVELSIDGDTSRSTTLATVLLSGRSFVPAGSSCPSSSEFVIIGTLGPHSITYRNETTGVSGTAFDQVWVCNSDSGRSMRWNSSPISVQPGPNRISVTMSDATRSSSAVVTVLRQ